MTEEKLVERVTALFADSDAAQRKMIRLYAETNDAIEASAIIDSGAEVLHMLQGGLRPEVLVLDSVLSDTTIFPLLRSIRQQQIEYEPHMVSITCRKPCILRSAIARRVPWGSCAPKQGSRLA